MFTDTKSSTGFRLVPTSVTLNDLEWRNSPYVALFHRIRLLCRPIIRHSGWRETDNVYRMSSSTFGQNWPTLQRSLSAI